MRRKRALAHSTGETCSSTRRRRTQPSWWQVPTQKRKKQWQAVAEAYMLGRLNTKQNSQKLFTSPLIPRVHQTWLIPIYVLHSLPRSLDPMWLVRSCEHAQLPEVWIRLLSSCWPCSPRDLSMPSARRSLGKESALCISMVVSESVEYYQKTPQEGAHPVSMKCRVPVTNPTCRVAGIHLPGSLSVRRMTAIMMTVRVQALLHSFL